MTPEKTAIPGIINIKTRKKMWIRCTGCSSLASFSNTRGSKISNLKCKCGGSFERLLIEYVDGEHPTNPDFTFTHVGGPKDGQKYHAAGKNKTGELFDLDRMARKAIPIIYTPHLKQKQDVAQSENKG